MNELIKITTNEDGKQLVSARELYDGLGMNKAHWKRWSKQNIENNEYFLENNDWTGFTIMVNGNETKDYAISLDFAKHIAMMARTEKSHEYRNYFIECEKKLKQLSLPSYQIEDPIARAERWIQEYKEKVALEEACKQKDETIKEITSHALTIEDSRNIINRLQRVLGAQVYHGNFSACWNAVYTQYNYLHNTNLRARKRKQGQSILSTLNEKETYNLEIIIKNLCTTHNIDITEQLVLK